VSKRRLSLTLREEHSFEDVLEHCAEDNISTWKGGSSRDYGMEEAA
jgi:hypothetical protein